MYSGCCYVPGKVLLARMVDTQKQPLTMFLKKVVHKNFAIFTEKQLFWSLCLIKGLKAFNFIKKRVQHRCFPV